MLLVIFSIEDARGRDRGRDLQQNEKNLFVNQLPEGPWYKRERGERPGRGRWGKSRKVGDPPFPPVVAFKVQ